MLFSMTAMPWSCYISWLPWHDLTMIIPWRVWITMIIPCHSMIVMFDHSCQPGKPQQYLLSENFGVTVNLRTGTFVFFCRKRKFSFIVIAHYLITVKIKIPKENCLSAGYSTKLSILGSFWPLCGRIKSEFFIVRLISNLQRQFFIRWNEGERLMGYPKNIIWKDHCENGLFLFHVAQIFYEKGLEIRASYKHLVLYKNNIWKIFELLNFQNVNNCIKVVINRNFQLR